MGVMRQRIPAQLMRGENPGVIFPTSGSSSTMMRERNIDVLWSVKALFHAKVEQILSKNYMTLMMSAVVPICGGRKTVAASERVSALLLLIHSAQGGL